jgi:hypothetical protein
MIKAWAADTNIDYISPQLYSSGMEGQPVFDETSSCKATGCTWDLYKNSHAAFVPSIITHFHYPEIATYF